MLLRLTVRRALSTALAVWLSGFVLLLSCNAGAAADSCPLAKYGHCDKAEKMQEAERISRSTPDGGADCCFFSTGFFDKTRSLDTTQFVALTTPKFVEIAAAPQRPVTNYRPTYTSVPRIVQRQDTFLKTCSFRI